MGRIASHIGWIALAILGAFALGYVALVRGESINALWIVVAAVSIYLVAYRYYSLYIAKYALGLDGTRMTPAWRHNDGLDYVPTNKYVLYGHHFAAIAGAGPLVGPVLAAQMGYLPGMLWLIAGVVLAGAVQDVMVLFVSTRRDGRSLGDLVKMELGFIPGIIALFGAFMIMIIILAVLAMVVVKALTNSPWGTFTVMATIPIAILMGVYTRFIRPGKIAEMSVIGFILLMLAILGGGWVQDSAFGQFFLYKGEEGGVQLAWIMIIYGFIAAVLPVWLLLAPRDYLSTFLKIGTIIGLAIGVVIVAPNLQMEAVTKYASGFAGPVWPGGLFPFLFITIACGAISGFHALISSGTTPKMLENETHARFIGYGGMLMESFVGIMALIAACVIQPGIYFAMNSPVAMIGADYASAVQTINSWGFSVTPEILTQLAADIGEPSLLNKGGGAPTLAVGMAQILHGVISGPGMMSFWYHFAILFEALFILTAVDAGTRAGRFMLQDLLGTFVPSLKRTDSWVANIIATAICVAAWGYILILGVRDPLGGIYSLWPLFGIANQMLAAVALILCAVVLFKMKRGRVAWVALLPTCWLLICTLTAGYQKLFYDHPGVSFIKAIETYSAQLASGKVTDPAQILRLEKLVFNNTLDAVLMVIFIFVVVSIAIFGLLSILKASKEDKVTVKEVPYEPLPASAQLQPAE